MAQDNSCSMLSPINGNFLNGVDEHLILTEFNNVGFLKKGPNEMPAVSLVRDENTNYEEIIYYPKLYTGEKVLEIIIPQTSLLMYVDDRWPNDGTDFVPTLYVGKWHHYSKNGSYGENFNSFEFSPTIEEDGTEKVFKFSLYENYNITWDKIIITRPGYVNENIHSTLFNENDNVLVDTNNKYIYCRGHLDTCCLDLSRDNYNNLISRTNEVTLLTSNGEVVAPLT